MGNIVAIVGRPNVGKSTLFNRLTESRSAIVDEASGVTRDRHYGKVDWNGKEFTLIDTGGYVKGSDDIFEDEIRKQVVISIEECDLIIFVVDVTSGVTDLDQTVASLLRKANKKVLLVSNKVDNHERIIDSSVFYGMGISDEIHNVSSVNGSGTGDLLDEVVNSLEDYPEEDDDDGDNTTCECGDQYPIVNIRSNNSGGIAGVSNAKTVKSGEGTNLRLYKSGFSGGRKARYSFDHPGDGVCKPETCNSGEYWKITNENGRVVNQGSGNINQFEFPSRGTYQMSNPPSPPGRFEA